MVVGFDGVATVEIFCPGTGRWSMISPMRMASRPWVKVVALNSILYVVVGWDGQQRLISGDM